MTACWWPLNTKVAWRLKEVVTGAFGLSSKQRAASNYAQLEQEIQQQQSDYNEDSLRREVEKNQRLDVDYDGLAEELVANTKKVQQSLGSAEGEELRKRVAELERQPVAAVQMGGLHVDLPVQWKSPTPPPTSRDKGYDPREGMTSKGDVIQMGRNLWFRQNRALGEEKAEAARQADKDAASDYSNLSQAHAQKEYAAKSIEDVNKDLRSQLGTQRARQLDRVGGVGGQAGAAQGVRFSVGKPAPPALATIPVPPAVVPLVPASEATAPTQPPAPARKAEARARLEGAYSIAVPFPTSGRSFTFKKLKGDPEIAFTLLHRQVPATAARVFHWALAAALFWLLMRILSLAALGTHARRYGYLYGGGLVLAVLLMNVLLGLLLAVAYGVGLYLHVAKQRVRRSL